MANLTVGDMLDRAQAFEHRLQDFYATVRDASSSDGVRLLTHYLSRYRDHLPNALAALSPSTRHRIRCATIKYDDTAFRPERTFAELEVPANVDSRGVLDIAIELVTELISFYNWINRQPIGSEVKALIQSLLKIEETHVVELKKTRAMDYF